MSTEHLFAGARVLFGNELSPLLEKRALHEFSQPSDCGSAPVKESQVLACPICYTLWIPGITCRVKSADHKRTNSAKNPNKSKASKKRKIARLEISRNRLEKKLRSKLGGKFKPLQLRYIHYQCSVCPTGYRVVQAFPPQTSVPDSREKSLSMEPLSKNFTKADTKRNNTQPKPKPPPSAPSIGRSLNLQDFLL